MNRNFAAFCDDIRQEVNGKYLMIGCYGGSMLVQKFPVSSAMACMIYTDKLGDGGTVNIQYKLKTGAILGELSMTLEALPSETPADLAQIPVPPVMLNVSTEDALEIYFGVAPSEPELFGMLRIEKVEALPGAGPAL